MPDTFDRQLAAQIHAHGNWRALWYVVAAWLNVVSAARSVAKAGAFTVVCVTSWGSA
jgi:hypothetical protein